MLLSASVKGRQSGHLHLDINPQGVWRGFRRGGSMKQVGRRGSACGPRFSQSVQ